MQRYALRDDQWTKIKDFLPGREGHVVAARPHHLGAVTGGVWGHEYVGVSVGERRGVMLLGAARTDVTRIPATSAIES